MDLKLGLDLNNKLLLGPDGSPLQLPPLTQGDTVRLVLQGMELTETGDYRRVPISFTTIKAGLGLIDAPPKFGTWRMVVDGDETPDLAYNISKGALETALNALDSVTALGGLKVLPGGAGNIYAIRWNVREVTETVAVTGLQLFPKCFARVTAWDMDYGLIFFVKIFQAPVAFTDMFALPTPPALAAARVRAGTGARDEVQRITVPDGAQGEFSLTWSGLTTAVVPVSQVSSTAIATALNELYTDGVERFRVTQPGLRYFYVQFVGPLAKAEQAVMTVTMESQPLLQTPVGKIVLDGPGVEVLLDGAEEVPMKLEIEVIDGEDSGTPVLAEVTVLNDMIDAPMALVADPDWLQELQRPSATVDYDPESEVIGMLGYQSFAGDGVVSVWNYTHNLDTLNLHITVRDNTTGFRIPDNTYTAEILNQNQVRITFPEAPEEDQYVVIISAANAEAHWRPHTHGIDEITGLQAALDALSAAGNPLELWPSVPLDKLPMIPGSKIIAPLSDAHIPANIPRLDADGYLPLSTIPPEVPRIGPDGSLVWRLRTSEDWRTLVGADGLLDKDLFGDLSRVPGFADAVKTIVGGGGVTDLALSFVLPTWSELYPGRATVPNDPAELQTAKLSRAGGLLPAIHDATVANLADPLPEDPTSYSGQVFVNAGSADVAVPGGLGRRGAVLRPGEHLASDGRAWYRVARQGTTTSYHPVDFERELLLLEVNEPMLPVGSLFHLLVDFEAQVLRSATRAQWVLIVEHGTFSSVASPAGTNIANITWAATPLITCPIHVTAVRTPHRFGVRVARGESALTTQTRLYRNGWSTVENGPAAAGFVVRARLTRFDVEDGLTDPRGYIYLALNREKLSIATIS